MREAALTSATGAGNAAVVWGSLSQGCLCAEHLKQAGESDTSQHSSFVQSSDCSLAVQAPPKPNSCISSLLKAVFASLVSTFVSSVTQTLVSGL